jgi:hypothetical protein
MKLYDKFKNITTTNYDTLYSNEFNKAMDKFKSEIRLPFDIMKFIELQLNIELLEYDNSLQKEVKEYIENLEKEYSAKVESCGTTIIKEYEHYKRIIEGQYSVKIIEMKTKLNDRLSEYRKLLL